VDDRAGEHGPDANVFAEDENWGEVSRFQLQAIRDAVAAAKPSVA